MVYDNIKNIYIYSIIYQDSETVMGDMKAVGMENVSLAVPPRPDDLTCFDWLTTLTRVCQGCSDRHWKVAVDVSGWEFTGYSPEVLDKESCTFTKKTSNHLCGTSIFNPNTREACHGEMICSEVLHIYSAL